VQDARRQAALEQDQGERDHPDRARQPVVVELDPAEAVAPHEHPEAEEQHEPRYAQAHRQQRGHQCSDQQRAAGQQQVTVRHASR
jgi:hypothetical protein